MEELISFLTLTLGSTITIFTIMNPLSAGVVMLSLLDDNVSKKDINTIAWRNSKAMFATMLILFLSGIYIFEFFGISPHGLRVFGGLILLVMGFNMVQGHGKKVNHTPKDQSAAMDREDISVVPLAIPIMAGPGMATTLINLSTGAKEWQDYASAALAILICCVASLIILRRMPFIKKSLGINGLKVLNRLMGLIVGSLAAQMIFNGTIGLYNLFTSGS